MQVTQVQLKLILKNVSIDKTAVKNVVKESKELLRLKEAEKMQNNFDGNKKNICGASEKELNGGEE